MSDGLVFISRKDAMSAQQHWSDIVFQLALEQGITNVSFVPDAGLSPLIKLCEESSQINVVRLTSEDEGVSLALGSWLGGVKSLLLMQSSGVGNCINMLSMLNTCQIPLPMIVTMRGDWGEFNPWQVPMGQGTDGVLKEMGVTVFKAQKSEEVPECAEGAIRLAFNTFRATAVLVGQRVLGAKTFGK